MRQTLGFIAVWCGTTVLAVSVTWFGVRGVLRSQVFDDARIESLNAALVQMGAAPLPSDTPAPPTALPGTPSALPSPGRRTPTPHDSAAPVRATLPPRATGSPADEVRVPARSKNSTVPEPRRSTAAAQPDRTPSGAPASAQASAAPTPSAQAAAANGDPLVVAAKNGSVSFAIDAGVCRLVAATPNAGYEAKVSQADGWIRVDLVQEQHGSAVFCIGRENRTDVWEY